MLNKNQSKNKELMELRVKLFDIEGHILRIESANALLSAYSDEHSPETSIIATFIKKELEEITALLSS